MRTVLRTLFAALLLASAAARAQKQAAGSAAPRAHLSLQLGHSETVNAAALSEDGKLLLTGGEDKLAILWDAVSGVELVRFEKAAAYIEAVALFAERGTAVTAGRSGGGRLFVYDTVSGALKKSIQAHGGSVYALKASPDGKLLLSASEDGTAKLWNIDAWTPAGTLKHGAPVAAVAFSADGKTVALAGGERYSTRSGANDYSISVWDVATRRELRRLAGHDEDVRALAFLPDGRLVSAGADETLKLWDAAGGLVTAQKMDRASRRWIPRALTALDGGRRLLGSTLGLAVSADGASAVVGSGRATLVEWDAETLSPVYSLSDAKIPERGDHSARRWSLGKDGAVQHVFAGLASGVRDVAVSPLGDRLAASGDDGRVRLWPLLPDEVARSSVAHAGSAITVRYDRDGGYIATCGTDGRTIGWDLKTMSANTGFARMRGMVYAAVPNADGTKVYSADSAGTFQEVDARTGALLRSGELPKNPASPTSPGASGIVLADELGLLAVSNWGGAIGVFDLAKGALKQTMIDDGGTVSLAYDPTTGVLASSDYHGSVTLRDLATGKLLRTIRAHPGGESTVAFSRDGKRMYTAGHMDDALYEWDPATGQKLRRLKGSLGGRPTGASLSVFPKDDWLVSGGWDGRIRLWDLRKGEQVADLVGAGDGWLVVTPDGRFDGDETARKSLRWVRGYTAYPLDSYLERYFVPGLLDQILTRSAKGERREPAYALKPPPSVAFESPAEGDATDLDEIAVRVSATDQGGGVDEIRLYDNGRRVDGRGPSFTVKLARGRNRLEAVAFSKDRVQGLPAKRTVTKNVSGVKANARLFAVGVGIDRFQEEKMNLNFPVDDARELVSLLGSNGPSLYADVKRFTLLDDQATKTRLLDLFKELEATGVDDTVVLLLSAHGGMGKDEWYFVPHDWLPGQPASGVSSRELAGALKRIPAQHIVLLLDACQSGGALSSFGDMQAGLRGATARLSKDIGIYVIAAAQKEQYAAESKLVKHGLLTYAVLEALSGRGDTAPKDGTVSAQELVNYIRWRVPELSDEVGRAAGKRSAQVPDVSTIGEDFALLPANP